MMENQERPQMNSREIIRAFHDSEWRDERLSLLKKLRPYQDLRTIQFLMSVLRDRQDLGEQTLAIRLLSEKPHPSLHRFLKDFFLTGPDHLKSECALALGMMRSWNAKSKLRDVLFAELKKSSAQQNEGFIRNLFLSLSDLKDFSVLPKVYERIQEKGIETAPYLVVALSKLERSMEAFDQYVPALFEIENSFVLQTVAMARTQVMFRSQMALEDYLERIFEGKVRSKNAAMSLGAELGAFPEESVLSGLEMFLSKESMPRIGLAFSGLSSSGQRKVLETILNDSILRDAFLSALDTQPDYLRWVGLCFVDHPDSSVASTFQKFGVLFKSPERWFEMTGQYPMVTPSSMTVSWINSASLWGDLPLKADAHLTESSDVFARYLRALSELRRVLPKPNEWVSYSMQSDSIRPSLYRYLEEGHDLAAVQSFRNVLKKNPDFLKEVIERSQGLIEVLDLKEVSFQGIPDSLLKGDGVRALASHRREQDESFFLKHAESSKNFEIEIASVVALKNYPKSQDASRVLIQKLKNSKDIQIQGRALDALCEFETVLAKDAVVDFLEISLDQDDVIDKIFRCFRAKPAGSKVHAERVQKILSMNPGHPSWEKLSELAVKLLPNEVTTPNTETPARRKTDRLLDEALSKKIPFFQSLEPSVQSALRSAERPFFDVETQATQGLDHAPIVLEFCKALDLFLDLELGRKLFFPKVERKLGDFQRYFQSLGFLDDYPDAQRVIEALELSGKITPDYFPLHKAKMLSQQFFNGKILQDRFKIMDGLRAWAVIFLFLCRKNRHLSEPLIPLPRIKDADLILISKRLMQLQDLRNPAAHRQTYTELESLNTFRDEAYGVFQKLILVRSE